MKTIFNKYAEELNKLRKLYIKEEAKQKLKVKK